MSKKRYREKPDSIDDQLFVDQKNISITDFIPDDKF